MRYAHVVRLVIDNDREFFSIICPGFHQWAQTQGQSLDFYIGLEGLREAEYVQILLRID